MVTRGIVLASRTKAREVDNSIYYLWNSGHVQPRIPPCFFHLVVAFDLPCDPVRKKASFSNIISRLPSILSFRSRKRLRIWCWGRREGAPQVTAMLIFHPPVSCSCTFVNWPRSWRLHGTCPLRSCLAVEVDALFLRLMLLNDMAQILSTFI